MACDGPAKWILIDATRLRITRRVTTLVIFIIRSRFMARTLYKEGACHDFVRRDVSRNWQDVSLRLYLLHRHDNLKWSINEAITEVRSWPAFHLPLAILHLHDRQDAFRSRLHRNARGGRRRVPTPIL